MIRLSDNAKKWLCLSGGVLCFLFAFSLVAAFRGKFAPSGSSESVASDPDEFASTDFPGEAPLEKWVVYVTGEVARPGVYEVTPGSRVNDAVRLAGGFTAGADREAVNLAEKLADEDHIAVPGFLSQDGEDSGVRRGDAVASPRRSAKGDERLDINAASAAELTSLPGIGPKLAEAIVSYRERNGRFESVDDLRLVGGIGEKRLEAVRELVRAGK